MVHKRLRGPYLAVIFAALFAVVALFLPSSRVAAATATSCSWSSQTTISCSGETFTQSSTSGSTMTLTGNATNAGCADTSTDTLVVSSYTTATSGKLTTYDSNCNADTSTASLSGNYSQESNTCPDGSAPVNGACASQTEATCGGGVWDWAICPSDTIFEQWAQDLLNFMEGLMTINTDGIFGTGQTANATSGAYYRAWNTFRVLAIGLIVIAGLVMVGAQAYGLEILDAYTIRKVLPRLLVAIIGISLSWPLMNFVINFFNVLGRDLQNLMYAPFSTLPDHSQLTGGIAKWGFYGIILSLMALKLGGILLPILGIGALDLLVAVLVLVIRQVYVVVLVITAPFAIAAYVLPNTKKIWDFWRDNFLGLMFMFPIVAMLMAAGQIFGAVGKSGSTVQQIVGIVAFFVPYFLIPFAFRMASGIISNISGWAHDRRKTMRGRLRGAAGSMASKRWQDIRGFNAYSTGDAKSGNMWRRGLGKINTGLGMLANANQGGLNPGRWREQMHAYESRHSLNAAAKLREENEAFKMYSGNDDFLLADYHSHGNEAKLRQNLRAYRAPDGKSQRYDNDTIDQVVAQIRNVRQHTASDVYDKTLGLAMAASGTGDAVEIDEATGKIISGGAGAQNKRINEIWGHDRVGAVSALVAARSLNSAARRFDMSGGSTSEAINTLNYQFNGTMNEVEATVKTVKESLEGQGGSYVAGARKPAVKAYAPMMLDNLKVKLSEIKTRPDGTVDDAAFARELAKMAGRYDAMAQVAPENADIIANQVMSQVISKNSLFEKKRRVEYEVTGSDGKVKKEYRLEGTGKYMTVQEMIEAYRNHGEFDNMRREYGAAARQGASDADAAAYNSQLQYQQQMQALGAPQGGGPIGPVMPPPVGPVFGP